MLTLVFTGDVRFCRPPFGPKPEQMQFDAAITDLLERSDYRIFNIEGPITEAPSHKKSGKPLCSPPEYLSVLERLRCNVFNLANNHAFDHGLQGFRDTVAAARERGWQWLGAGENLEEASKPLILRGRDVAVGLISVCHREGPIAGPKSPGVFCHDSGGLIRERIGSLKRECDFAGVVYHGGEEVCRVPIPARRKRLIGYLRAGADFVVSHHAHVVQGYEYVDGKPIFYGLGNFLFHLEMYRSPNNVNESVVLSLQFEKGRPLRHTATIVRDDRIAWRLLCDESNPSFQLIPPGQYNAVYKCAALEYLIGRVKRIFWDQGLYIRLRHMAGLVWRLKRYNVRPMLITGTWQFLKQLLFTRKRPDRDNR